MTWEEIEEGAAKLRVKRGKEGGASCKTAASKKRKTEVGQACSDRNEALCAAKRQDDHHSHVCMLPECGVFATPEPRIRAGVQSSHQALLPGRQNTDRQFEKACVSKLSPNSHTVQDSCMHLYRLPTIAEVLQASSHPGRCDENFCGGSFCNGSCCDRSLSLERSHLRIQHGGLPASG